MTMLTSLGQPRQTLASQLDRLDGILDSLHEGLHKAVAAAVEQAVAQAVQDAVPTVLAAILSNPSVPRRPARPRGPGNACQRDGAGGLPLPQPAEPGRVVARAGRRQGLVGAGCPAPSLARRGRNGDLAG